MAWLDAISVRLRALHVEVTVVGNGAMQTGRTRFALTTIGFDHAAENLFDVLAATRERRLVALLTLDASAHAGLLGGSDRVQ